jgi:hypothetical protein
VYATEVRGYLDRDMAELIMFAEPLYANGDLAGSTRGFR